MANEFNAVVDAQGRGDFRTLAEAETALQGGPYMVYVKQGHYAPGTTLTISSDKCLWIFEPGCFFDSAIVASGDAVCIMLGTGCIIQGLITTSGIGCSVVSENGCQLVGILASGARCYATGGGWDTLSDGGGDVDGIRVTGDDFIVENISVQTTPGGGNVLDGVSLEGSRAVVTNVRVVDSDNNGIGTVLGSDTDCLVKGCVVLGADAHGIFINGPRERVIGNYVFQAGNRGIRADATGDNAVMLGNLVQDAVNFSIDISVNCENCTVVGNRTDGAILDDSGTSTVAQNDETAF